ncbi:MAG TPA: hypothetical protein VGE04_16530 [Chloroflexia bacterium]|jgi:hypothetical protein
MGRYHNDSVDFDDLDIGISVMEELDPEPGAKSGSVYAREFVVGVVLVLAVLAFAGWQWWQTEFRQSNYRLGEQAARRYDWDEARDRFSIAEGYRDADKRAEAASNRVQERDEHYSLALEHFNSRRWAAALKELRTVREVQPGYRDLASMEQQAEQQVYKDALLGSVALRATADPPGLYYRTESAWVWLKGSDEYSLPWGQGTPDHVLYDAPIEGWVPPAPPDRPGRRNDPTSQRMDLEGRKLMVAALDAGGATLSSSDLPFNLDDFSWFEWNHEGVWGIRYSDGFIRPDLEPGPVRDRIDNIQQITYHAFGTKIMRSTNPTYYGMNVAFMGYNPDGDGLLVANWTRHEDGTFTTALYLNSLTKGENKLLYNYDGGFVNARFSEDSRYVFLTTYKPTGDLLEDHALLMIDTTGAEPVRSLLEQKGLKAPGGYTPGDEPYMAARLLPDGLFGGNVLLTQWVAYTNYISVLDPAGLQPTQAVGIGGNGRILWDVVSTQGPDLVLLGTGSVDVSPTPLSERQTLFDLRLRAGESSVVGRQTIAPSSRLGPIQRRGSELVYLVYNYTDLGQPSTVELYGVSLTDPAPNHSPPRLLHRYEFPRSLDKRQPAGSGFRFTFGPGMFAYLDGTTIRAVTYDGQTSLPLEDDVTELFSLESAAP